MASRNREFIFYKGCSLHICTTPTIRKILLVQSCSFRSCWFSVQLSLFTGASATVWVYTKQMYFFLFVSVCGSFSNIGAQFILLYLRLPPTPNGKHCQLFDHFSSKMVLEPLPVQLPSFEYTEFIYNFLKRWYQDQNHSKIEMIKKQVIWILAFSL